MNLLFLFHFVFRQAAFGLVIGSPNLPVLDDGDVSGIVGKTYLRQVTLQGLDLQIAAFGDF